MLHVETSIRKEGGLELGRMNFDIDDPEVSYECVRKGQ